MKEEDLDRYIDSLIIDGLIKESEQDNADFENAMRSMSDDAFYDIILGLNPVDKVKSEEYEFHDEPKSANDECCYSMIVPDGEESIVSENASNMHYRLGRRGPSNQPITYASEPDFEERDKKSLWHRVRPWIISAFCAAAFIAAVIIPINNHINARLCDNALYISEAYMNQENLYIPTQQMPLDKVESELPALEQYYEAYKQQNVASEDLQRAGCELATAYLRLHKRSDAVKVLNDLAEQFKGTDFGTQCATLVKTLE